MEPHCRSAALTARHGSRPSKRAVRLKPRELAPIAELLGLDDLGRALPRPDHDWGSNEARQMSGEIQAPRLDRKP